MFGAMGVCAHWCLRRGVKQLDPGSETVSKAKPFHCKEQIGPLHSIEGFLTVNRYMTTSGSSGEGGVCMTPRSLWILVNEYSCLMTPVWSSNRTEGIIDSKRQAKALASIFTPMDRGDIRQNEEQLEGYLYLDNKDGGLHESGWQRSRVVEPVSFRISCRILLGTRQACIFA